MSFETKTLKKKKLDKECSLKMTQNDARIFVEFSSEDGKLVLQKSFQNTFEDKKNAEAFSKTIKSIKDLRKYFGLDKK